MTETRRSDNSRTITNNSFWYAIDASAATIVMLFASVPVARIMGPEALGQYIYLVFITGIAQRLANVGIPATACKYMAEYLGAEQPDIAHEIYRVTLKYQILIATGITAAACAVVQFASDPNLRLVSFLVVLSMWPGMVSIIPANANMAAENLRANVPASLANFASYLMLVLLTLFFGWGLVGLATATLVSRSLEAAVRYAGVRRWIRRVPPAPLPSALRRRMFQFSRQNLVLLALGLVVWDRSELLFLKHFSDIREVAFYSLPFSIVKQLLSVPVAFSSAIGVTMFAQYGRDKNQLGRLTNNATRYLALLAVPLFLGLAAIAEPLVRVVYGQTYLPVIPALLILSVLAIPRAFQVNSESVLQATENQGFMVRWLGLTAVVNLLLDWLLIPRYGALGAAFANGIAQLVAVGGVWIKASLVLGAKPPFVFLARLSVSGVAMAGVVLVLNRILPPLGALALGIPLGVVVFTVSLRLTRCLELEDLERFRTLAKRLPTSFRPLFELGLRLLVPSRRPSGLNPVETL